MSRRTPLLILLPLLAPAISSGAERPNIVYIMADELGYHELSLMGHPYIRTPRIDRMARETRPQGASRVRSLPPKGLIPRAGWKIHRVSSESRGNGRLARHAIDGDPRTHWHTRFEGKLAKHPHELVIDLGAEHTVRGFRYLARQDGGWNGAIGRCEFYVGRTARDLGNRVVTASFERTKKPQEVACEPVKGRYVVLRILSEVGGGPWASVAELGVVGE